jgi:large subunit ribosomal protein L10
MQGLFLRKEVKNLAISKKQKEDALAHYVDALQRSNGIILTDYSGLKVSEVERVRRAAAPVGGSILVTKNRLLKLALEEAGYSLPDEYLTGPTMVGFCFEEVPPLAKMLVDASKNSPALQLKGGLIDNTVLTVEQVKAIADLPPREVVLSQALGTINAPASRITGVVASAIRQILNVLQAYVDKVEETSGSAGMEQAAEPA